MKSGSAPAGSGGATPWLLYACTGLAILVLLATNLAVISHLRESALTNDEGDLRNLSLTLAEQADRSFQSLDLVLSSLSERLVAAGVVDGESYERKMSGYDIHLMLEDKISGIPQIDAITMIGPTGKLINFSRYWPIPAVNVTDRDYFQAMTADPNLKSFISMPVQNRGTGTWTIYLARRVSGPSGEFAGLVLGAMTLQYFEDFYRAIKLDAGSAITLVRNDGTLLVRFPPAAQFVGKSLAGAVNRSLGGAASGTVREVSPVDGQMRIKAAHRLANYPLYIIVTETEFAALKDWRSLRQILWISAIACALSIMVAGLALRWQWRQREIVARTRSEVVEAEQARATAEAELQRQQERTAAYEVLRLAKETAEHANRAKSEFLATMSHELRTPLNAILGFSDVMMSELMGPVGNEKYHGYVRDIHESGTHLLAIINDILDLSKAEAGKLELTEEAIELRAVVDTVCRIIMPRTEAAELSFIVTVPPAPLLLYGDERKLKQMLLNLLSNAVKFTRSGGEVELAVTADASGLAFVVRDTGIGIPATDLDRVLEPFAQVESALSRSHEGTGLGLPLVKAVAELHGGSLHLASEVGTGTTATVTLPPKRVLLETRERAAISA